MSARNNGLLSPHSGRYERSTASDVDGGNQLNTLVNK